MRWPASASKLGLSAIDTAWGIHRLVTENMAAAARIHIVEKGKDPRRYAMVGFGGAGPAHAAEVARILGVQEVLIPPASGAASALGFLAAPLSFEQVRSHPVKLDAPDAAAVIDAALAELEARRPRAIDRGRRAGGRRGDGTLRRHAPGGPDARDQRGAAGWGAGHDPGITAASLPAIRDAFATAYAARYTSVYAGVGVQAISFRVRCRGPLPRLSLAEAGSRAAGAALKGTRPAWFGDGFVDTPVYDRYALTHGHRHRRPRDHRGTRSHHRHPSRRQGVRRCERLAAHHHRPGRCTGRARHRRSTPIEQAAALIEADPVSLEIMWSRLVTVVEEMWQTICRTAFSLIMSEAQDFACDLLDARGESLAHSPRAMPVFNLTLPRAVKSLLQKFPAETLQPGDVLITNDPWLCAGHLFDIAVVTPVFRNGTLVALTGTVGHVGDIGGTKDSLRAREIYEEGIQIPPMMLYRAGVPNDDLLR